LRLRDQGQWVDVGYDSLRLESRLAPNRVDTSLDFRGPKLGELRVQAQIDPRPASKPLSGEFSLPCSFSTIGTNGRATDRSRPARLNSPL
ncbi:hypothetical protein, partial [Pseudomonas aeruginosa]|uniref:hypothetical protein n=1 Tax=Pseudomonas aeruginosa TaxID=287 RepID=UPI0024B73E67